MAQENNPTMSVLAPFDKGQFITEDNLKYLTNEGFSFGRVNGRSHYSKQINYNPHMAKEKYLVVNINKDGIFVHYLQTDGECRDFFLKFKKFESFAKCYDEMVCRIFSHLL